jgi:very-short-patch-repair endonuclease
MSWKNRMHGNSMSKAEIKLHAEMQKRGLHPDFSTKIVLKWTVPDEYYENTAHHRPLAVYLDTAATHRDTDRDDMIDEALESRGIKVLRYRYHPPISEKLLLQIADEVEEYVKEPCRE